MKKDAYIKTVFGFYEKISRNSMAKSIKRLRETKEEFEIDSYRTSIFLRNKF